MKKMINLNISAAQLNKKYLYFKIGKRKSI